MADLLDRITINPNQCGGRPCIRGMRIRVTDVLDLLAEGQSQEEILEAYPYLEPDDIAACLRYAVRRLDHTMRAAYVATLHSPSPVWVDAQLPPALSRWLSRRDTLRP